MFQWYASAEVYLPKQETAWELPSPCANLNLLRLSVQIFSFSPGIISGIFVLPCQGNQKFY
jgi:hypothetical protein